MAHSNGVITAPVGIDADIAPVLGVGSYDLGYLCSNAHGKINKWSYIKPKEANTPNFKGYFCDYNGNVLCMIPSSSDGLVKKPIVVTQSLYIYIGETTANASGFAVTGSLVGGDGGTSAQCRRSVTNNTSNNYVASTGRPYARYRWRAKDGSYTGSWLGNISMPSCANIPKSFTRMDTVDAGSARVWVSLNSAAYKDSTLLLSMGPSL